MFDSLSVIGAGGTGSILAPLVARYLAYKSSDPAGFLTTIVDGDSFDEGNSTRQPSPGHGVRKCEALADAFRRQGLQADAVYDFLGKRNAHKFIKPNGVILLTVDNHASRKLSLAAFAEALDAHTDDMLWLSPGNSSGLDLESVRGTVLWWGRINGDFVGMNPALVVPNIAEPRDLPPVLGSCANDAPSEPQLLVANAMAASWSFATLALVLEGLLPQMSSLDFDLTQHTFS